MYTILRILAFEVRRCEFVCFAERRDNTGASSHARQRPDKQVKDDGILPPGNNVSFRYPPATFRYLAIVYLAIVILPASSPPA